MLGALNNIFFSNHLARPYNEEVNNHLAMMVVLKEVTIRIFASLQRVLKDFLRVFFNLFFNDQGLP